MKLILFCLLFSALVRYVVSATIRLGSIVIESVPSSEAPFADQATASITHKHDTTRSLSGNSAAGTNTTKVAQGVITMVAGAATLDLTAAPGLSGPIDLTGLKIRSAHFWADATNANPIKVKFGAANPYTGFGADFAVTLSPGKEFVGEPTSTAVAAGVKNLDVSGTLVQKLNFIITAGDN